MSGLSDRNHTFDFLCGLCILRMVLLHIVSVCGHRSDLWMTKLMAWSFFFMCFFFFKAGFFNKTVGGNSWNYCKDKFRRLMIPYFVWGGIGTMLFIVFHLFYPEIIKLPFTWKHTYTMSHFYGNPPCWFLLSFFCSYIIIHFIEKIRYLKWVIIVFPFISYYCFKEHNPLWLSLDNIFMGLFCFFLGQQWHWVQKHLTKTSVFIISIVLLAFFIYGNKYFHGEYDMSLNKWVHNPWGAFFNATFALTGISGLLMLLPQRRIPVINYMGQHSMTYFVAHYPVMYIYRFICRIEHHSIKNYTDMFIMLAVVFIVCTLLVPLVERVPWLSGRWKKK